jgi:hypothetical protein
MREVNGLAFENTPRVLPRAVPKLPTVIPMIYHGYRRSRTLNVPIVGLPLYDLVNLRSGKLRVDSRQALADRFLIPADAVVVLSGVDRDETIERWWQLRNRSEILAEFVRLGIAVVTSPNYSVFTDVPRTDNLYAMKRILLAWAEMAAAGLSTALHVNGRTEKDYQRWGDLAAMRPEIEMLAFEFGTGSKHGGRINWHVGQLCKLADRIDRPLSLIIRGGGRKAVILRQHFARVTLIETDSFTNTRQRQRAMLTPCGRLTWISSQTPKCAPLDDLLERNVALVRLAHELGGAGAALRGNVFARRTSRRNDEPIQPSLLLDSRIPG